MYGYILGAIDKTISMVSSATSRKAVLNIRAEICEYMGYYCIFVDDGYKTVDNLQQLIHLRLALHYLIFHCEMLACPDEASITARSALKHVEMTTDNDGLDLGIDSLRDNAVLVCRIGMGEAL